MPVHWWDRTLGKRQGLRCIWEAKSKEEKISTASSSPNRTSKLGAVLAPSKWATGPKARGGIQLHAKETTLTSNARNGEILPEET